MPYTPAPPPPEAEVRVRQPRHLWDYWRMAWEGKWILVASLGVTVLVAVVGTFAMHARYRAVALIEINLSTPTILGTEMERGMRGGFFEQDRAMKTEFVRIRTRDMLARAIEDNGLGAAVPALGRAKDPIGALQSVTKVDLETQTNVAKLSVSWTDPKEAATLANAVAKTYCASDLAEVTATLRDRAVLLRGSAQQKQAPRRAEIERELALINAPGTSIETLLGLPVNAKNEGLKKLAGEYNELERDLESLRRTYGPNHDEVRQKTAARNETRRQISDTISAVKTDLENELRALGGDPENLPKDAPQVTSVQADADAKFEEQILKSIADAEVHANIAEPKAKIIDPALPPPKPYAPSLGLNLALALVVGLGFGGGLVFFRDYLDVSVKTLDDVERDLGLNVLTVVPMDEARTSPVAKEAFQTLRTGLLFASSSRRDRVLLVTSAGPREGKSSVVASLAASIAGAGESVIVVDWWDPLESTCRHASLSIL